MATPPAPLTSALREIRDTLTELRIPFALVGGLAVSARAEPRLTRDVDVAVKALDDAAAESVVRQLIARGYRVSTLIEYTARARLATIRLHPPGPAVLVVDLLFASCGIEPEIVDEAEMLEVLPRMRMPVARAGHLIAMKLLAADDRRRPQDLDDIRALLEGVTAEERRRVARAIALIERRGFSRRRDLGARWRAVSASRTRRSASR